MLNLSLLRKKKIKSDLGPKINIQNTAERAGNWLSEGRSRTGEITGADQEGLEGAMASLLMPAGC